MIIRLNIFGKLNGLKIETVIRSKRKINGEKDGVF